MFRPRELEVHRKVCVDEPTYKLLRQAKKDEKKSMMRIIKDLILKKYGLQEMSDEDK